MKPETWFPQNLVINRVFRVNYLKSIYPNYRIYGNEQVDKLAKASANRAHKAAAKTNEERRDEELEAMADSIVAALTTR